MARLALALAAAQTAAHAESWAWQLLAHTPFNTVPRTPLMPVHWEHVGAHAFFALIFARSWRLQSDPLQSLLLWSISSGPC